jgi:signal transduction histidine kinase/DNA-binding NarL/FixJ family response regulator
MLNASDLLRLIDEGTASATGSEFFKALVRSFAEGLQVRYAFVTEFIEDQTLARPFAAYRDHAFIDRGPFRLKGTPCELTLQGDIVAFDNYLCDRFPHHREALEVVQAESYLAIPLKNVHGVVVGHLAVIDSRPRDWQQVEYGILRIFGARAAAEVGRIHVEQRLDEARARADAANQAKNDFLAGMSHELRTQLNGILGYAQLLARDDRLDGGQQESIRHMDVCGQHLLHLINDVLDIAKLEAGKLVLHSSEVELSKCLDEIVALIRVSSFKAGINFRYEPSPLWPEAVLLDEHKLRQILLNLLTNALKYTPQGEVGLRVFCYPRGQSWHLRFEIWDTGIGIDVTDLERIFEPFIQINGGAAGAGLGLTVARRLAELLDGRLNVISQLNSGSEFTLELNVPGTRTQVLTPAESRCRRIVGTRGPRRRILIAEDKQANRLLLKQILESLGFDVCEAADGAAAIELALTEAPDLILMDLVMPEIDGFDAVRRLRSDPRVPASLPIVAISASAFDKTRIESQVAGCDAFLSKPISFEEIARVLERLLGLEWLYEAGKETPGTIPAAEAGSLPPGLLRHRLEALYDLACLGDIMALKTSIEGLQRETDPAMDPFVAALFELAQRFDTKGIRERLRPLLESRS